MVVAATYVVRSDAETRTSAVAAAISANAPPPKTPTMAMPTSCDRLRGAPSFRAGPPPRRKSIRRYVRTSARHCGPSMPSAPARRSIIGRSAFQRLEQIAGDLRGIARAGQRAERVLGVGRPGRRGDVARRAVGDRLSLVDDDDARAD